MIFWIVAAWNGGFWYRYLPHEGSKDAGAINQVCLSLNLTQSYQLWQPEDNFRHQNNQAQDHRQGQDKWHVRNRYSKDVALRDGADDKQRAALRSSSGKIVAAVNISGPEPDFIRKEESFAEFLISKMKEVISVV